MVECIYISTRSEAKRYYWGYRGCWGHRGHWGHWGRGFTEYLDQNSILPFMLFLGLRIHCENGSFSALLSSTWLFGGRPVGCHKAKEEVTLVFWLMLPFSRLICYSVRDHPLCLVIREQEQPVRNERPWTWLSADLCPLCYYLQVYSETRTTVLCVALVSLCVFLSTILDVRWENMITQ